MATFLIAIAVLVVGYFTYGKFIEKIFGVEEERKTLAYSNSDGVDYVTMGKQKNAMIQLLNIAGKGKILGPLMEAPFGPVDFLWIILGSIFAGAGLAYVIGI